MVIPLFCLNWLSAFSASHHSEGVKNLPPDPGEEIVTLNGQVIASYDNLKSLVVQRIITHQCHGTQSSHFASYRLSVRWKTRRSAPPLTQAFALHPESHRLLTMCQCVSAMKVQFVIRGKGVKALRFQTVKQFALQVFNQIYIF